MHKTYIYIYMCCHHLHWKTNSKSCVALHLTSYLLWHKLHRFQPYLWRISVWMKSAAPLYSQLCLLDDAGFSSQGTFADNVLYVHTRWEDAYNLQLKDSHWAAVNNIPCHPAEGNTHSNHLDRAECWSVKKTFPASSPLVWGDVKGIMLIGR